MFERKLLSLDESVTYALHLDTSYFLTNHHLRGTSLYDLHRNASYFLTGHHLRGTSLKTLTW